jgi:hypothetical protein
VIRCPGKVIGLEFDEASGHIGDWHLNRRGRSRGRIWRGFRWIEEVPELRILDRQLLESLLDAREQRQRSGIADGVIGPVGDREEEIFEPTIVIEFNDEPAGRDRVGGLVVGAPARLHPGFFSEGSILRESERWPEIGIPVRMIWLRTSRSPSPNQLLAILSARQTGRQKNIRRTCCTRIGR